MPPTLYLSKTCPTCDELCAQLGLPKMTGETVWEGNQKIHMIVVPDTEPYTKDDISILGDLDFWDVFSFPTLVFPESNETFVGVGAIVRELGRREYIS